MLATVSVVAAGMLFPSTASSAPEPCLRGPDKETRGLMRGNIDGVGSPDRTWFAAKRSDGKCRYFLKMNVDAGTFKRRIRGDSYNMTWNARPMALVRIDAAPGREVALKTLQGASVGAVTLFTLRGTEIRKMNARGRGAPDSSAWLFAGSLSGTYAVDCAYGEGPTTIIASEARPKNYDGNRKWWIVERRWFETIGEGDDLYRTDRARQRELVRYRRIDNRFPEFRNGGLLQHCEGNVRA